MSKYIRPLYLSRRYLERAFPDHPYFPKTDFSKQNKEIFSKLKESQTEVNFESTSKKRTRIAFLVLGFSFIVVSASWLKSMRVNSINPLLLVRRYHKKHVVYHANIAYLLGIESKIAANSFEKIDNEKNVVNENEELVSILVHYRYKIVGDTGHGFITVFRKQYHIKDTNTYGLIFKISADCKSDFSESQFDIVDLNYTVEI